MLSAPAGASLTGVTLIVSVLADRIEIDAAVGGAAVVLHLEGEVAYGAPFAFGAGVNTQVAGGDVRPAEIVWPAATATAGQRQAAGAGQRGDHHRLQRVRRVSFGSVKPKSAAVEACTARPRCVVTVLSVPAGRVVDAR